MQPQPPEELAGELSALIQPGARERLVARGLARGMIWRDGVVPQGAQPFARSLTADLLDHGYLILAKALQLKEAGGFADLVEHAFRTAAESIESAVRRDDPAADGRGFHLVVSACAFHLAHLAARSYCLVPAHTEGLNLSSPERVLVFLMRRDLKGLRETLHAWLSDPAHTDAMVAERLAAHNRESDAIAAGEDEDEPDEMDSHPFGVHDAIAFAITRRIMQGIARFEYALRSGDAAQHRAAVDALRSAERASGEGGYVTLWWASTLARHLIDELWGYSLHERLPIGPAPEDQGFNDLRARFIRVLTSRSVAEIDLWPSQTEAARRSVNQTDDLVVALPTSAGKTRIAELCILRTLAAGQRVVYVTPLRALSAQLERTLGRTFRPLGYSVSSLYGASGVTMEDVRTLRSAQIVVSTPEKLDFSMRQEPGVLDDIGLVVLDEGHMIGDSPREIRYEVLVQRLLARPDVGTRRIVCLSAIFSAGEAFTDFTAWLRSDEPGLPVESTWRPTRQRSAVLERLGENGLLTVEVDGETPFVPQFIRPIQPPRVPGSRRRNPFPHDGQEFTVATALALVNDGHRVLVYCPLRSSVESLGEKCIELSRHGFLPNTLAPKPAQLRRALRLAAEWLGDQHVAAKALRLGIGLHHGGLPRPFLAEIERLLSERVLPIVVASPTVAQGLDLSCSALVFHSIYRNREVIEAKEYANVIGRAGRAFVDLDGLTVYPVFERGREGRYRVKKYNELRASAQTREMESGILLLIDKIAEELTERLACSREALLEYVLNHGGAWEEAGGATASPAQDGTRDPLPALLSDLDTAILSTVENLDCATDELAAILDAALRSSLWRRRLERKDAAAGEMQRAVLRGRARWLWSHSAAVDRRACFASGVGHATGRFIAQNLEELLDTLVEAEAALAVRDDEAAIVAITRLAEILFQVHPFKLGLPEGWKTVLAGWVTGQPTSGLTGSIDGDVVTLIQDAFVYRLVWGVESVRVHGLAQNDLRAILLAGTLPMVLTYGLPTLQGNLLAQAGLASRQVILRLLESFPGEFTTPEELAEWIASTDQNLPAGYWPDGPTEEIWRSFVDSGPADGNGRWVETELERPARWDEDAPLPAAGTPLQLVHDPIGNETRVYAADLTQLGVLTEPYPEMQTGHSVAAAATDERGVLVKRFAPAARRPAPRSVIA